MDIYDLQRAPREILRRCDRSICMPLKVGLITVIYCSARSVQFLYLDRRYHYIRGRSKKSLRRPNNLQYPPIRMPLCRSITRHREFALRAKLRFKRAFKECFVSV